MSGSSSLFSKSRFEAFSDGVLAVIITIMVLDLKAPRSAEPLALAKLWPSFAIYLVVEFHEVVHSRYPDHGRLVSKSRVWPMPVVVMDEGLQRSLSKR